MFQAGQEWVATKPTESSFLNGYSRRGVDSPYFLRIVDGDPTMDFVYYQYFYKETGELVHNRKFSQQPDKMLALVRKTESRLRNQTPEIGVC